MSGEPPLSCSGGNRTACDHEVSNAIGGTAESGVTGLRARPVSVASVQKNGEMCAGRYCRVSRFSSCLGELQFLLACSRRYSLERPHSMMALFLFLCVRYTRRVYRHREEIVLLHDCNARRFSQEHLVRPTVSVLFTWATTAFRGRWSAVRVLGPPLFAQLNACTGRALCTSPKAPFRQLRSVSGGLRPFVPTVVVPSPDALLAVWTQYGAVFFGPTSPTARLFSIDSSHAAGSSGEWNDLARFLFMYFHFSGPRYLRHGLPDCLQVLKASAEPCLIAILFCEDIVAADFKVMGFLELVLADLDKSSPRLPRSQQFSLPSNERMLSCPVPELSLNLREFP